MRAGASPDWAACEGLLLLLRDTIAVLPDHTLHQVHTLSLPLIPHTFIIFNYNPTYKKGR